MRKQASLQVLMIPRVTFSDRAGSPEEEYWGSGFWRHSMCLLGGLGNWLRAWRWCPGGPAREAGVGMGQLWCPGYSQAPLRVTCMSPSGCPRTPRSKGREGRACGVGACESYWAQNWGRWTGGGSNGVGAGPVASDFGCLTQQGMFVEGPPGPEGPAVSIL